MERIIYRKTLDTHKNGVQFLLQGFETEDKLSRTIEISLMASGDAIDFPLEQVMAMMYITTPKATEPSINECVIKDNKIIYDVLPIVEEGITTFQLKLIETGPEGARSVLCSPKFAIEVLASSATDSYARQSVTFTALEDAVAAAKGVYDKRLLEIEVDDKCIFRAYYADGAVYETDAIKECLEVGHTLLSKSYAMGESGAREGEATDNSKYYSNVARSSSEEARIDGDHATDLLNEVRKHGVYTSFAMDFDTGELKYVSPSYQFAIDEESGELTANGKVYNFDEVVEEAVGKSFGELAEGLGKAKYESDLFVNYTTPTFVKWDTATLHTPYTSGISDSKAGFALIYGDIQGDHTIAVWGAGYEPECFIHTITGGVDLGWDSYLSSKGGVISGSDLGLGGGKGNLKANNEEFLIEAKKDEDTSRALRIANPDDGSHTLENAVTFTNVSGGQAKEYALLGMHNAASLLPQFVTPLIPEIPKSSHLELETGTYHGDGAWEFGVYKTVASQKGIKPYLVFIISGDDMAIFSRPCDLAPGSTNSNQTRYNVKWEDNAVKFYNSYYWNGAASGSGSAFYSLNKQGVNYYYTIIGTKEE